MRASYPPDGRRGNPLCASRPPAAGLSSAPREVRREDRALRHQHGRLREPRDRGARRASRRGGGLRVGLDGRARGAPRSAGAALAGPPEPPDARPGGRARLRRGEDLAHPPRNRDRDPPAAQPRRAREGAREPRRALGRAPRLRPRRRLPAPGVRRRGRALRRPRRAHRRVHRRDPRALDRAEPALRRARGALLGHRRAAATGAEAAPADRRRRPQPRGLPPRGLARRRLVRLPARPRDRARGRGGPRRGGPRGGAPRPARPARDQHHAAAADRLGRRAALPRPRRRAPHPARAAPRGGDPALRRGDGAARAQARVAPVRTGPPRRPARRETTVGRLDRRVALVTGAASGIGAACAARFAAEGASVAGIDVQKPVGGGWREVEQKAAKALFLDGVDVRREAEVQEAVAAALRALGRIDVLVNAAGVGTAGPRAHELPVEEWERVVDVNLKGSWLVAKHVLPAMLEQRSGSIVNLASIEGLEGLSRSLPYNASKGGVVLMTKNMALDYAKDGIRVNCLCPGLIDTPLTAGLKAPEARPILDQMRNFHAMERAGRPEEVAACALFLASDDDSFVTGHSLVVDGGWTAGRQLRLE